MSEQDNQLKALMATLFGDAPVIQRVLWSEAGQSACFYAEDGNVYGGAFEGMTVNQLIEHTAAGDFGQYFSTYEPVEPEVVAEKLAEFSDWKEVYPVKG